MLTTEFPSVTTVLKAVGFTQDYTGTSLYYRERGTGLHLAIEYDLRGTLDESTLHPDLVAPFEAWRRFRAAAGPLTVLQAEREMIDLTWRFKGHPDLVCLLGGRVMLLDYKCTESPDLFAAQYQLGGYRHLWNGAYPERPIVDAAVLQLSPRTGQFKLHARPRTELAEDTYTFLAAVRVYHALGPRRKDA